MNKSKGFPGSDLSLLLKGELKVVGELKVYGTFFAEFCFIINSYIVSREGLIVSSDLAQNSLRYIDSIPLGDVIR